MANDCIVINLESEIDDPTLPVLGALDFEIAFTGTPSNVISAFRLGTLNEGCPLEIVDNGHFYSGFGGTAIGKNVTKTGNHNQNPVYLKPEVTTKPVKIRIRNAFTNITSFGNPSTDWAPSNRCFTLSDNTAPNGWNLWIPSEIQYSSGIVGFNGGTVIKNIDKVNFLKLPLLKTLITIGGVNTDIGVNNLFLPNTIERIGLSNSTPTDSNRRIVLDLIGLNKLILLDFSSTNHIIRYSGSGDMLSTNIISYWTQNEAFELSNTAQFDLYLQALSLCTFTGSVIVRVSGTRTSASNIAVATLVSKLPGRFYINGTLQS